MLYSEERKRASFDVHVMLDGMLSFSDTQLAEAIEHEFPGIGSWTTLDVPIKTDEAVSLGLLMGATSDTPSISLSSRGNVPLPTAHYETAIRRANGLFPAAAKAFADHTHYLSISVPSRSDDFGDRFLAARIATCVSAVLAEDPACKGIVFPSGDIVCAPEQWRSAAADAHRGEWPIAAWVSFEITPVRHGEETLASCASVGVAAFNGHEFTFPAAPVHPSVAIKSVYAAAHMQLQRGHVFVDSDTMGDEEGEIFLRIRHMPEGGVAQTNMWVLLHPQSILDEDEIFGPRSNEPAPPSVDNRNFGDDNFMKRLLFK